MRSVLTCFGCDFRRERLAMLLVWLAAPGTFEVLASTTIYVGKHFEVREHDQPTKYVFNGDSRVARITGSLSSNTRVQRLRLGSGWNLRALALAAPDALHQFTNSQPAILDSQSIFQWSSLSLSWLPISPGQSLAAGTILWIHATTNTTLAVTGAYADPANQPVAVGGSFVPGSGLEALSLATLDLTIWRHDTASQTWNLRAPDVPSAEAGSPQVLAPGEAIFINARAAAELETPEVALRVCYYHQDHLGSSSAITDATGALVEETSFYPFGTPRNEHRLRQIEESYKFTQKERDRESNLHYFEARYLAGHLARFITLDRKFANPDLLSKEELESFLSTPQKINLYSYTIGNPVRYVDSDGADVSTPFADRDFKQNKDKSVTVTLKNGVKVRILEDREVPKTSTGRQAETGLNMKVAGNRKKGTATVTWTIQTNFKQGVKATGQQSYGRGTTKEDINEGHTTIGFHEGEHGRNFLDQLEKNAPPEFNPGKKKFDRSWTFDKAGAAFGKELNKYFDETMKLNLDATDCVGAKGPKCN
jgi:RHS repeat-associated protein